LKLVQQLPLMVALSLCATHAFADGDSADIKFTGSIKVPPCTVNQVQPVNLGTDIQMSTFKGAGSESQPVPFQVSMTCPAGIKSLSYKLTPAGGSQQVSGDGKDGEMTLSNSNGASGVAVKIMNGDGNNRDPIPLGQNNPVGDKYDPSKFDQTVTLNYLADYIQTDANVKGGEADAQAQFTLSYE